MAGRSVLSEWEGDDPGDSEKLPLCPEKSPNLSEEEFCCFEKDRNSIDFSDIFYRRTYEASHTFDSHFETG